MLVHVASAHFMLGNMEQAVEIYKSVTKTSGRKIAGRMLPPRQVQ